MWGGGGGGGGGADDKFVILLVKKGYGLVSAFSQPYRTWPPASCDSAGFIAIEPAISHLASGLVRYGWLHADTRPYPFFTSRITNIIISSTVILAADWSIAVGYWIVFHCFSVNGNVRIRISVLSPLSMFYPTSPWQLWV